MSTKAFVALFTFCVLAIGIIPEPKNFDSAEDFQLRESTAEYVCSDKVADEGACRRGVRMHMIGQTLR